MLAALFFVQHLLDLSQGFRDGSVITSGTGLSALFYYCAAVELRWVVAMQDPFELIYQVW